MSKLSTSLGAKADASVASALQMDVPGKAANAALTATDTLLSSAEKDLAAQSSAAVVITGRVGALEGR